MGLPDNHKPVPHQHHFVDLGDFFERVRNGYLRLAESEPQRWSVLDAGDSLEGVRQQLQVLLDRRLPL